MNLQNFNPIATLGYVPASFSSSNAFLANATASWYAFAFTATVAKQLSKFRFRISAVTGTLATNDITCELWSDSAGGPGTMIEARNTVTTVPSGASFIEATGFTSTSTVSAGVRYWIVIKNAAAAPATNYFTIVVFRGTGDSVYPFATSGFGPAYATTANSGGTWTTSTGSSTSSRWEWSDGTFLGWPLTAGGTATALTEAVYGTTREVGVKFTVPSSYPTMNVTGLYFAVRRLGTPGGNFRFRLYSGSSTTPMTNGTTGNAPAAPLSTSTLAVSLFFPEPIVLTAGSVYRGTISHDGTGTNDSTNYVGSFSYTFENDSNSLAFRPLGNMQETYLSAGAWDDSTFSLNILPFALILDTSGEFTVSAGGGGQLVAPNGGMRG